ncbi:MAG: flagellar export chaperone FliS [Veillonellales bacterium]
MVNANMANAYKRQQILTASPEELTLLLYNGALRFVHESITAMEQGQREKSSNANLRAQEIVREFMATLDMKYELSKTWMRLYDYIEYCLIQGNIKQDKEKLEQARHTLQELRDAWVGAMKQVRSARAVAK